MKTITCDKCAKIIPDNDYINFPSSIVFDIEVERKGKGNSECPNPVARYRHTVSFDRVSSNFDTTNTHFCSECKLFAFKLATATLQKIA